MIALKISIVSLIIWCVCYALLKLIAKSMNRNDADREDYAIVGCLAIVCVLALAVTVITLIVAVCML